MTMPNAVMPLSSSARQHWRFLIGFPIFMVIMTWPTIIHVFDAGVFWLPTGNKDIWMKFWDAWRLPFIIADSRNYFFSDGLFYPDGLSLVYHNFSFPHMIVFGALQKLMPASNAFNLSFLLIVGANGVAAYLFLLRLFRNLWLAFAGAVIFALSPFVLSQPHHPDVILIAVAPLSLYFLDRGLLEERWHWTALSGFIIAATLFIGMYIYVCLVFTVGLFLLGYAKRRWSSPAFWRRVILLTLIAGSFSFLRVYPLIENSSSFEEALDKRGGGEQSNELLASFVNSKHPLVPSELRERLEQNRQTSSDRAYLGYIPLLLIAYGLLRGSNRRRMAPWLILLLLFFALRLGSNLVIFGQRYDHIVLPKHFLDQLLPFLFESFWDTSLYQIGLALPLVVLACFGLMTALNAAPPRHRVTLVLSVLVLTCFEYYLPLRPLIIASDQTNFLNWLKSEEDQDRIRLIHLPMGRHESKVYGYYQSLSGYPHVEGLASRTPPSAYDTINGHLILSHWRRDRPIICLPASRAQYLAALDQLQADGFTHVVLHANVRSASLAPGFNSLQPAYEDSAVRIYRLAQLKGSCANASITAPAPFAHFEDLALSSAISADQGMSILSFHPSDGIDDASLRYLSSVFIYWKSFAHVYLRDGELILQTTQPNQPNLSRFLEGEQFILSLHNPSQVEAGDLGTLDEALAANFHPCHPVIDSAELVAAYYLRTGYDCALISSPAPFDVQYDNDVRLANRQLVSNGDSLEIQTWWTSLPAEAHGVSIQLFDQAGEKVAGSDFTIRHDALSRHQLDLSSLAPGDYNVAMILYNYQTRVSVPGTVTSSQARFERALDLGLIGIE
ncbi:MAG: glycosyltransferase family 39 protein [Chloroflexi bacterium]|nr:glycosyltransferase family 39 protein [Chloroflexota bacterium]